MASKEGLTQSELESSDEIHTERKDEFCKPSYILSKLHDCFFSKIYHHHELQSATSLFDLHPHVCKKSFNSKNVLV